MPFLRISLTDFLCKIESISLKPLLRVQVCHKGHNGALPSEPLTALLNGFLYLQTHANDKLLTDRFQITARCIL